MKVTLFSISDCVPGRDTQPNTDGTERYVLEDTSFTAGYLGGDRVCL